MTAVWAHRGCTERARENTLTAFRAARQRGADGVELDVRSTADGVLVLLHDAVLDGRPVAHLAAAELPPWLPTLEAALEECRGMAVNIEVKNLPTEAGYDPDEGTAIAAARAVTRLDAAAGLVISAFAMTTIDAARTAGPGVATGWLTLAAFDQLEALELVVAHGHAALHSRHEAVTPELVAAAHDRGVAVNTWTVDDPHRIRAMAAAGVDAVITNAVGPALVALGR